MAVNSKKRQRKLEKKSSKRKSKKRDIVRMTSRSPVELLRSNPELPIVECWRFESLFKEGIGHVHLSRQLSGDKVVFVSFLVDAWCLGVKNIAFEVYELGKYRSRFSQLSLQYSMVEMAPSAARKLVEDAVEYADSLGFAPHADYEKAKLIFGGVDPTECDEEFTFGKDGKPFFFSGPNETPARCREIMSTLRRNCGTGNFEYFMQIAPDTRLDFMDDDNEFDDDDDGPAMIDRL